MTAKLTQFITSWLRKNVVGQVGSAEDVPYLVSKCLMEASRQGITREQLEAELGPLEDCIRGALKKPPAK